MDNDAGPSWTFLTNHARVLILIAREPDIRIRDIAAACDITERTAQSIVADLESTGYLSHTRHGRRNRYLITPDTRFRHRAEADHKVAELLELINQAGQAVRRPPEQSPEQAEGGP